MIAYGQTGTGKTYTMEGARQGPDQGIIPRAIEDIFMTIESDSAAHSKYLVRASHLQIYNEVGCPMSSNVLHTSCLLNTHIRASGPHQAKRPFMSLRCSMLPACCNATSVSLFSYCACPIR